MHDLKVFSGNSNPALAKKICDTLGLPLGKADVRKFSDGETWVEIHENVRGSDVFLIQSTCSPANDHLMEILVMADAFKRASARQVTAVIPYYGYARQDRKVAPRVPITAKLVADLLEAANIARLVSVDLHAGQIQGFFNVPVDHLFATPVLVNHLKKIDEGSNMVVVSPDAGGVERARAFAKHLGASLAIIDKRRERANVSEVMNVVGEVKGKKAILIDDIIDTAGTLTQAVPVLKERGATEVYAACTHAVLSGPAIDRLNQSEIHELVVTDTIPLSENGKKCKKIRVLTISELLGEAIKRIHGEDSVSSLFL